MAKKAKPAWQVPAAIALFVTAGPLLVIINKAILRDHGLHLPALVSAMGIIFTSIFTHILVALGAVQVKPMNTSLYNMCWQLLPVGICSSGTFMFGNMSYVYLDAGFIQMLKTGTPALLLFMLVSFKIEKISVPVGSFVIFMVAGSVLAVSKAPTINYLGLFIMFLSEICEGLRCVSTQVFLQKLDFSIWDAGYYMAPMTAICCLLLSLATEFGPTASSGQLWEMVKQSHLLFASGLVGIAVNFASYAVIKLTSSLLTKLLVAARNAGLVLFFVMLGEEWTGMQVVGYIITLVAFTGYSVVKVLEARVPKQKKTDTVHPDVEV